MSYIAVGAVLFGVRRPVHHALNAIGTLSCTTSKSTICRGSRLIIVMMYVFSRVWVRAFLLVNQYIMYH